MKGPNVPVAAGHVAHEVGARLGVGVGVRQTPGQGAVEARRVHRHELREAGHGGHHREPQLERGARRQLLRWAVEHRPQAPAKPLPRAPPPPHSTGQTG